VLHKGVEYGVPLSRGSRPDENVRNSSEIAAAIRALESELHFGSRISGVDMSALHTRAFVGAATGLVVLQVVIAACSSSSSRAASDSGVTPQLWGEMKPIVSVKELMRDMLDPIADNIFDAVGTIVDANGTVEHLPRTDADWEKIRIGGVTMAEGAYLLKVRRPWAPPGDENNSTGPDAVELSPAQISAKVEKDPVEWNARIEALRNVGREVLDIVQRRDVDELWDAAENLDQACEGCHRAYWYPGETPEYYRRLDRRLREFDRDARKPTK
jgi:hypothetical protein